MYFHRQLFYPLCSFMRMHILDRVMKFEPQADSTAARKRSIRDTAEPGSPSTDPAAQVDAPPPPPGSLVRLDRETHRVLAHIGRRLLFAHVANGTIYLVQEGGRGDLRLPTRRFWVDLVREGRAEAVRETPREAPSEPTSAGMSFACDILDAAGVPLGVKAMEIWLHANWGPDLTARWGPHGSVHTLRFWRRERRRRGG